jgi:hypothetical protein
MHLFATTTPAQVLELGKMAVVIEVEKPAEGRPVTGRSPKSKDRYAQTPSSVPTPD